MSVAPNVTSNNKSSEIVITPTNNNKSSEIVTTPKSKQMQAQFDYYKDQQNDYGFSILNTFDFFEDESQRDKLINEKIIWKLKYIKTIERQNRKWSKRLLKESDINKLPDLKLLCRIGIVAELRPDVWFNISKTYIDYNKARFAYDDMIKIIETPKNLETYAVPFSQIDKDVERTFPTHPYFQTHVGIESLRSILRIFVMSRPDINYCQSMNFIAGIILLIFSNDVPKAHFVFLEVVGKLLPADYFTASMKGVHSDLLVLDRLLQQKLPKIYQHMKKHGIEIETVCLSWFSCIFLLSLPIETALRVWDSFLHEGSKILFRVSLGLFKLNETRILSLNDTGYLYAFIKDMGKPFFDCDKLMNTAFDDIGSLSGSLISDLRSESLNIIQKRLEDVQARRNASKK